MRFTQLELAVMLGIHRTYLVLIEKGKKIPSQRLQRTIDEFIYKVEKKEIIARRLYSKRYRIHVEWSAWRLRRGKCRW